MVIGKSACVQKWKRAGKPALPTALLYGLDQILDLHRVRAKFCGEFVKVGIGEFLKTGFVDVGDYFNAKCLKLVRGLVLQSRWPWPALYR